MVALRISDRFRTRLALLSEGRREHIINRMIRFQRDPQDPQLRLRPLRCAPGHSLIDSARYDRIVLRTDLIDGEAVYTAVDCGGHEIIEEWERAARPRSP
ncbi:hypothetical protein [Methylobacterium aquaticum]|uniref:Uncharacterized protein n=1 Tax=Methylobacterium aquaticum TaxID=270351 RepID=A0A0C6FBK4_9HYPH|nr:hypothetical protein [Methylobacterium aquaticum]BAQ44202.1 hypothetical protein Maq22A_c03855 [Methylobacterium aquaticum]